MVVKIGGGLGNQMFMYAFARALQCEGCEVVIDGSFYTTNGGGGIALIAVNLITQKSTRAI